jgi:Skp family chaperone for outer membrane proteins
LELATGRFSWKVGVKDWELERKLEAGNCKLEANIEGTEFMRALKTMMIVGALAAVLAAGPALAQTPPVQQPPAQQPPAQQPPAQKPPAQQPPITPQPQPPSPTAAPKPFPEGAKFAYIDLQRIAATSAEGKAAAAKIQEYEKKKLGEIQEKTKQVEEMRKKLEQGGTVMSEAARGQIEKDIDRTTRELQFMQQSAQAERDQLERELNAEFQKKLNPIIEQVATEKGLHMLFSIRDNGAVWANTGLDLSAEVVKRFDDATKGAPDKK